MSATIHTPPTKSKLKEFISMLKRTKKELALSNEELALYTGVPKFTLGRWMGGERIPSSEMIDTVTKIHDDVIRQEASSFQHEADVRYGLVTDIF